jgi:hypothetical protein
MHPARFPLLHPLALSAALTLSGLACWLPRISQDEKAPVGYDDTPLLPDSRWRVHDGTRPHPRPVASKAPITTPPPADATVLFDGKSLDEWRSGDGPARWTIADGALVVNGTGSIQTRESFGDVQLHLEWATPAKVEGSSQGRGNSGVFLMGRYEIQVLDSFDNITYPDGQAAAMYGQKPPLVNASSAPGTWQSYDILFHAPRFEGERLLEPARVTVLHNGICVHHDQAFLGATRHREVATYEAHPPTAPLELQDHGNPVRYRNIWIRPLGQYDE